MTESTNSTCVTAKSEALAIEASAYFNWDNLGAASAVITLVYLTFPASRVDRFHEFFGNQVGKSPDVRISRITSTIAATPFSRTTIRSGVPKYRPERFFSALPMAVHYPRYLVQRDEQGAVPLTSGQRDDGIADFQVRCIDIPIKQDIDLKLIVRPVEIRLTSHKFSPAF
ncbi:hypothetical protein [Nonomuraea salmonea]|uniref:hypothetical protein n=1 Tax=Nonomuraea salmonea TaxID=46181 RepID=UPI0031E7DE2F